MKFKVHNRRYTGSKYKLTDWIVDLIKTECEGAEFCDLFSGTSIVANSMLPHSSKVILNDLLYSNNIIYNAFYSIGELDNLKLSNYRSKYQSLDIAGLAENYASINFGGKFFSYNDAKKIGHIREDIESNKEDLTQKEYAILIASLLYSSDKAANTVGHYDAYIKNKELKDKFQFDLIEPSNTGNVAIEIHREDANLLVRNISCDIVYIDPPYNSRQYSRFYHVLENITKWEKPKLEGVALKPQPENMSEYCKSSAPEAFSDLISNLNCKYVVVSYNNTYNSKSNSSKNKIDLDFIRTTLEKKGRLSVFEKSHNFFNAGKTDFSDHKEFVFIVKVGE